MSHQMDRNAELSRQLTQEEISERFRSLVEQLPELGKHKHAERIAVLLDHIGCQDKILEMIDSGIHDLWLPMPKQCQPLTLRPTASKNFHAGQQSFLSDTFTIHKSDDWPASHVNLALKGISLSNIPVTLQYVRTLGEGGYGEVASVRCINGETYALKRLARDNKKKEAKEQMKYVRTELDILRKIRHQHFIRLVGSYTDWRHIGILMHPAADDNLESYLDNFKTDSESEQSLLARFFGCLAAALARLHYVEGIRHKDIKPQNILVHNGNILFTDFGTALDCEELGRTTTNEEVRHSSIYCAPEFSQGKDRNTKSDVWSLGCVFLEMVTVLKGRPRRFVRETLIRNGSNQYWNNAQGIRAVIEELRGDVSRWGDEPLTWAELMLNEDNGARPTSKWMLDEILQTKGPGKPTYCGYCCTTTDLFPRDEENVDGSERGDEETRPSIAGNRERNNIVATTQAPNQTQEAKVFDPFKSTWGEVQLRRDPNCSHNCVSPEIVARLNLHTDEEDEPEAFTFGETTIVSRKWATIRWMESYAVRTKRAKFLVAPQVMPFQMLLGAPGSS